jgi:ribosomal-protein-serine acetyltransferase
MFTQRINDRHTLRSLSADDADALFSVIDENRAYLRRWLPWVDGSRSVGDTLAFIESDMRQSDDNQGFSAGIWLDGKIAGVVGYHPIDWLNRAVSIGYWLAESQQGAGIMTASCRALVDHAFCGLNLNRVTIACATHNTRSRAIPERLGFFHEGIRRDAEWLYDHFVDHAIYSQLQREWQEKWMRELRR